MNADRGALRRPLIAAIVVALILAAVAAGGWLSRRGNVGAAVPPRTEKSVLMLITSLPLVFGEKFSLEGGGSRALDALETRYRVVPIGVSDAPQLAQGRLLLMAHPLAQPGEALVDLDNWVRGGGRVLILADPALAWPSSRPLGDRLRPPLAYADLGLLDHWGLALDPPSSAEPVTMQVDGRDVRTVAAGTLSTSSPNCSVTTPAIIARCRVGRGFVTVVADADFLDVDRMGGEAVPGNLDLLLAELERLER